MLNGQGVLGPLILGSKIRGPSLFSNRTETQSVTAGNQKLQNLLSSFSPHIPHSHLFSGLKTFLGFSSVGFRNCRIGYNDFNNLQNVSIQFLLGISLEFVECIVGDLFQTGIQPFLEGVFKIML